jgi:hypothetical protein
MPRKVEIHLDCINGKTWYYNERINNMGGTPISFCPFCGIELQMTKKRVIEMLEERRTVSSDPEFPLLVEYVRENLK